jgi:di/tricarboxylate transporter
LILAVMLLDRLPVREGLAMLREPAAIGVLCLVVFSGVLGRLAWLRNPLVGRRPGSPRALRTRFRAMAGLLSAGMPNPAAVGALMGPAARNAAFGASAACLVPIGCQTRLMVLAPGNDRVMDFVPLGLPVLLACGAASRAVLWLLAGPLRFWG